MIKLFNSREGITFPPVNAAMSVCDNVKCLKENISGNKSFPCVLLYSFYIMTCMKTVSPIIIILQAAIIKIWELGLI
jgi:hypothetical protein